MEALNFVGTLFYSGATLAGRLVAEGLYFIAQVGAWLFSFLFSLLPGVAGRAVPVPHFLDRVEQIGLWVTLSPEQVEALIRVLTR